MIPQMATARIGETKEQCEKRYGKPTGHNLVAKSLKYRSNGIGIECSYNPEGKCSFIQYKPVSNTKLAKKIWEINHPKWISLPSKDSNIVRAESVQMDGYDDMRLAYNKNSKSLIIWLNGEYLKHSFAHSRYDEVEGNYWYQPGVEGQNYSISYNCSYMTFTYLYIGVPDAGKPFLRLKFQYCGKGWKFINKYKIKIGSDDAVTLVPSNAPKRTVASGGNVREVFDELAYPHSDILNRIIRANYVIIRMDGSEGYEDLTLTPQTLDEFKKMILLYKYLGGEWSTDLKGGD